MTLETYQYLGLGTVVERSLPQADVALKYHASTAGSDSNDIYTGLDRFGRIARQLWWDAGDSTASVDFRYGYDESSNRLYREDKTNDSITVNFGELYGYDGLNQLIDFGRGELNETYTGLDTTTRSQEWNPDALSNFNGVTTDTTAVNRTHDGRNQLLTVGSSKLTYDDAGNMTTDETGRTFTYDAWNRLMSSTASSVTVNKEYDALSRRVVDGAKTLLYSDQWQVLEERDGSSTVTSNVWSPVYVDAILARDTFVSGSMNARFYALADANYNVVALVNTAGAVQERYVYDPYGAWTKLTAAYAAYTGPDRQWLNLHQGGRWDVATAMYHFRHRDLSASLMRWEKMDPIGLAAGDNNLVRYASSSPIGKVDPLGLWDWSFLGYIPGVAIAYHLATTPPGSKPEEYSHLKVSKKECGRDVIDKLIAETACRQRIGSAALQKVREYAGFPLTNDALTAIGGLIAAKVGPTSAVPAVGYIISGLAAIDSLVVLAKAFLIYQAGQDAKEKYCNCDSVDLASGSGSYSGGPIAASSTNAGNLAPNANVNSVTSLPSITFLPRTQTLLLSFNDLGGAASNVRRTC